MESDDTFQLENTCLRYYRFSNRPNRKLQENVKVVRSTRLALTQSKMAMSSAKS